ncbi:MAG TPA: hypothetical protein P5027_05955, partial [Flavobacteriales bacterium]|nr:hypothetical protein [Flavobacteriales bacterium]
SQIEVSRALYIYSSLIVAAPTIAFTLLAIPFHERPYDPARDPDALDLTTMVVVLASVFYSVVVSFRGVTTLADVDRKRAVIWFLVLPWLFYALAFTAIIGLLWSYFGEVL